MRRTRYANPPVDDPIRKGREMFEKLTEELLDLTATEKGESKRQSAPPALLCFSLCCSCSCSRPGELE